MKIYLMMNLKYKSCIIIVGRIYRNHWSKTDLTKPKPKPKRKVFLGRRELVNRF
jgi:hypothetical protein